MLMPPPPTPPDGGGREEEDGGPPKRGGGWEEEKEEEEEEDDDTEVWPYLAARIGSPTLQWKPSVGVDLLDWDSLDLVTKLLFSQIISGLVL